MSLCGEFVPNVDAITACMIRKKSQLSPQCRAFFRRGPEPGEVRAGAADQHQAGRGEEDQAEEEEKDRRRLGARVPFTKLSTPCASK